MTEQVEDILGIGRLASALDGGAIVDTGTEALVSLADTVRSSLHHWGLLDEADQERIYANVMRLADGAGVEASVTRLFQGFHLGRRSAMVLGGVAAGALAAAIGYAVIHERKDSRKPARPRALVKVVA